MNIAKKAALVWLVVLYGLQHVAKRLWKPVRDYRMMKSINRLVKESTNV